MSHLISNDLSMYNLYEKIAGVKFSFGPLGGYVFSDDFAFGKDGLIKGYNNENERFWNISQKK